jgi:hypothetical protein
MGKHEFWTCNQSTFVLNNEQIIHTQGDVQETTAFHQISIQIEIQAKNSNQIKHNKS